MTTLRLYVEGKKVLEGTMDRESAWLIAGLVPDRGVFGYEIRRPDGKLDGAYRPDLPAATSD